MKTGKSLGNKLSGKGREAIPGIAFRLMSATMKLMDFFWQHSNKNFKTLELKSGQTVIDYGCGPARYIQNASKAVGESGKVIAVDIHPMAIDNVESEIEKYHLENVQAVLANGYTTSIADNYADVIYALDMFHMIEKPTELLMELSRLLKDDGILILEDGHQPRTETKQKIINSGVFKISQETKLHIRCIKD